MNFENIEKEKGVVIDNEHQSKTNFSDYWKNKGDEKEKEEKIEENDKASDGIDWA